MNVTFYNFSKRRNSTKQPSGSGTVIDCKLKEGTSIKNPKLQISGRTFGYNYAYIADFGRYYFVNDVISESYDITTYVLEEDSLASNKTAIGNTVARIEYSSTGYDEDIIDPRIECYGTKRISGSQETSETPTFDSVGCYVLSVFNNNTGPSCGMATSYLLQESEMQKVRNWFGDDTVMYKAATYFKSNPLDSILGCIWVPFSYDASLGTSVSSICIGNQDSSDSYVNTISAIKLNGSGVKLKSTTVPIHLRYTTGFRMVEPYTTGAIFLPGIGQIPLNMSDWKAETNIYVSISQEYTTGNVSYILFTQAGAIMQTATCNVASQCPLGQVSFGGSASSAIGGAAGAIKGIVGAAMGNVAIAGSGLMSTLHAGTDMVLSANTRAASVSGCPGGRLAGLWPYITYNEFSLDTENPENSNYISRKGRPVALTHAINTHSGYVQCDGASVSIAGDAWERDQINSFLNSGFFYE